MHYFPRHFQLTALLLGLFSFGGFAQTFPPEITVFAPDEYRGSNQVFSSHAYQGGRTVFGMKRRVRFYDGENFDQEVFLGPGKAVFSMDADSDGRLYVGGASVMGSVVPDSSGEPSYHSLTHLLPDSLQDHGIVWEVLCIGDSTTLFNTKGKSFLFQGDSMLIPHPEHRFHSVFAPSGEPVLYEMGQALYHLSGNGLEKLSNTEELTKGKKILSILSDPEDPEKWILLTKKKGLFHYDPSTGEWGTFRGSNRGDQRVPSPYTTCALDSEKNPYGASFAIGTDIKGIFLLDAKGRVLLNIDKESGLPSNGIWSVENDDRGNLWVTTDNGIALLHTGVPFTFAQEGLHFDGNVRGLVRPERSLTEKGEPSLYLATAQGAWKWDDEEEGFKILKGSEGQCFDIRSHVRERENGEREASILVVGGKNGLLETRPPKNGKALPSLEMVFPRVAFSYGHIPDSLHQGDRDRVLIGGRNELFVLNPSEERGELWKEDLHVVDLPAGIISIDGEPGPSNRDSLQLWGGLRDNGVVRVTTDRSFNKGHVSSYDTSHGLTKGAIWITSDPLKEGLIFLSWNGIKSFQGERFVPDCRFGPIFCKGGTPISILTEGSDDELWVKDDSEGRIKHLRPEKEGYAHDSTIFRYLDLGVVRAILPEKERTFLGGVQGLASYYPGMEYEPGKDWDCRITQVKGSEDSLLFQGTFSKTIEKRKEENSASSWNRIPIRQQPPSMVPVLPYSRNRLFFSFAAAFPDRQDAVRYSYKLEGFDTTWSTFAAKAEKEYTNLPEGSYTFKAKAKNVYNRESTLARYRFHILPPWYRTWWAYGGYSVASLGMIWLLLWLNGRRLLAQKRRLEWTVEERTKEIREQKEEIERQKERVEDQQKETERQKEIVEEAHEEITQSIDYAQKIQYALLQSEEHVSSHLPDHFILFKPYSQVSGDFYWVREHKGYFYIAAVDCTGHGVPGAFMSMLGISQLNEIMNTDEALTPGEILTELRDRVIRELSGSDPESAAKDGMDAAILRIGNSNSNFNSKEEEEELAIGNGQLANVEVEFAGAQNPLYVVRKGIAEGGAFPKFETLEKRSEGTANANKDNDRSRAFKKSTDGIEIKGDGQPVGYDEYAKDAFTTVKLQLQKGDMLYIFSDGYADQFGGPKGKKFRYGPFKQLLASIHQKPLEEQKQELDKTFEDWKKESEQEQIDDVVVVGVRI